MATRYTARTNLQIGKTLIPKNDEFDPQAAGLKGRALDRQIEIGNIAVRKEKPAAKGKGNNGGAGGEGGRPAGQGAAGAQGSGQAGAGGGQPAA